MLAADWMDVCYRHPEIDTFILATGDGDFIHLVNELRPHGKTVIVVTLIWAGSIRLIGGADRVIYYDQEIDPVEDGNEPPAAVQRALRGIVPCDFPAAFGG